MNMLVNQNRGPLAWPHIQRPAWWWQLELHERRWVTGAAALVGLIVVMGVFAWQRQAAVMVAATQAITAAQQALVQERAAQAAMVRGAEPLPWWANLPAPVGLQERGAAEHLSAEALASAARLGVQVLRLSTSPQPPEGAAPYRRSVVQVEVKGGYADVKRWLSELLARRPHALALRSLDVRRGPVGEGGGLSSGIEATVELRLFERVSAAPAGPGTAPQRP
jgi:hypothetical protein